MRSALHHPRFPWIFLPAVCLLSFLLWLPTWDYPIASDTSLYALLGESFWTTSRYAVLGEAHGKHMPFHAIVSFPLARVFGYSLGMKLSTLFAGLGVLIAAYFLLERTMGRRVAVWTTLAIALHHGFVVMTMLGSADSLLTLLFLLSLHAYLSAAHNRRFYFLVGIFTGLACLTRYNAAPLFLFFPLYTLWKRPKDLFSLPFMGGMAMGAALFSIWFIRAYLVFGTLTNDYTEELSVKTAGLFRQMIINIRYYLNPIGNILPVLFLFSFYGIWKARYKQQFLIAAMVAIWSLFLIWPVLNLRYTFPGYVLLIAFGVFGIQSAAENLPRLRTAFLSMMVVAVVALDIGVLCLYSYGQCNARLDRAFPMIPKNLGLTMEGFAMWDEARDWINTHAETKATLRTVGKYNARIWTQGIFRKDIAIIDEETDNCPVYTIAQDDSAYGLVVFQTADAPVTYVMKEECK